MEKQILDAITNPLETEGIRVLKVELGMDEEEKTLFVVIDSDEVVDMNMCVKATKIINPIIDKLNLDLSEYVLDVGSKGVDYNER